MMYVACCLGYCLLFTSQGSHGSFVQEAVQQLAVGEPVVFVKEQSNPHDPLAVAIATLDGQQLGHVAKELTGAFPLQVVNSFIPVSQLVIDATAAMISQQHLPACLCK